ncbi:MAG: hypothetical protein ACK566_12480, partial [Bacteroidota bacterium]
CYIGIYFSPSYATHKKSDLFSRFLNHFVIPLGLPDKALVDSMRSSPCYIGIYFSPSYATHKKSDLFSRF